MSLLRFDPSGSIDPNHGVSAEQLTALSERLARLRSDLVYDADRSAEDAVAGSTCKSSAKRNKDFDWQFLKLPQEQLDQYVELREDSTLGRVFKIANGLHDKLDAVVVVAGGESGTGPRAVMQACCDPYHNELTRAARGSKPRLYFEANRFDNDEVAALLHRLAQGGYGESKAERRLAIVAVFPRENTRETTIALNQILFALGDSLKCESEKISHLVIPIAVADSMGAEAAAELDCKEVFDIPYGLDESMSVLSPVGLLPAAFLGLDCMKLLEGAVAMNEHFRTAPLAENMVTRFAAINFLLACQRKRHRRILSVWNKSLETLGRWYENLVTDFLGNDEHSIMPRTVVCPRDSRGGNRTSFGQGKDSVFHHVLVQDCRSDLLPVPAISKNEERSDGAADPTMQDILQAKAEEAQRSQRDAQIPTTRIILPHLDTYVVGQFLQMLMIATVVEARLAASDPAHEDESRVH